MSVAELRERILDLRELPPPAERRRLRRKTGVSTLDIARALGVTPQAVGAWERGERTPSRELLPRYLEILRIVREGGRR